MTEVYLRNQAGDAWIPISADAGAVPDSVLAQTDTGFKSICGVNNPGSVERQIKGNSGWFSLDTAATLVQKVWDTFGGGSVGVPIESHPPNIDVVGGGWSNAQGAAEARLGRAYRQTDTTDNINVITIDAGVADVEVNAIINLISSSSMQGLVLRWQSFDNHLLCGIGGNSTSNPYIRIYKRVDGTFTIVEEAVWTGHGSIYGDTQVKATAFGDTITWTIYDEGDELSISATIPEYNTTTVHGSRIVSTARIDNFEILG